MSAASGSLWFTTRVPTTLRIRLRSWTELSISTCPISSSGIQHRARRYAKAPDYPETAQRAIKEMHRQVGPLVTDEHGVVFAWRCSTSPHHAWRCGRDTRDHAVDPQTGR